MKFDNDGETTRNKILAIMKRVGPAPVREWTLEALEDGVWDEISIEGFTLRGAIAAVKAVERSDIDGSGLPWAAAVGKGRNAIHKTREMFKYEDYVSQIDMRVAALGEDHAKLFAWQKECRARFGTAPSIPELVN